MAKKRGVNAAKVTKGHGPFVKAAFVAERVLEEKDGVLTAIRIVDAASLEVVGKAPDMPQPAPPVSIDFTLVLMLVRGDSPIEQLVTFGMEGAHVEAAPAPIEHHLVFGPDQESAAHVRIRLQLALRNPGTYWFFVRASGRELTRIPLRVARTYRQDSST